MSTHAPPDLHELVALACLAPSAHNTQPWLWRIVDPRTIEVYADRSRQLRVSDPDGRNLAISCGAAIQHAVEAGTALGLEVTLELMPDPAEKDLLGRLHVAPGPPPADGTERLQTLTGRSTDRRRFTSWPVPDARVHKLAESASGWGAQTVPVTDVTTRFRAELLLEHAASIQASDPRLAAEQAAWVERSHLDGVPTANAVPATPSRRGRANRFAPESHPRGARLVSSSDGVIAICTAHDDQASWLRAGETLGALWLEATRVGLSVVPLSQVIEIPETRTALYTDVFAEMLHPQLLLRIGWQEIARTTLPRTPRRPISEVLIASH